MKKDKEVTSWVHVLFAFLSLALYLVDLGTDVFTAWGHAIHKHYYWMACTAICLYLPRLVTALCAIIERCGDRDGDSVLTRLRKIVTAPIKYLCCQRKKNISRTWFIFAVSVFSLPLTFEIIAVFLLVVHLVYCITGKENQLVLTARKYTLATTAMEATFESAPQSILQLYIILKQLKLGLSANDNITSNCVEDDPPFNALSVTNGSVLFGSSNLTFLVNITKQTGCNTVQVTDGFVVSGAFDILRIIGIFASFISVSWAITSLYCVDVESNWEISFSLLDRLIQFMWRACMVGARLIALVFFASRYNFLFLAFPLLHTFLFFVAERCVVNYNQWNLGYKGRLANALISNLDFIFICREFSEKDKDYILLEEKVNIIVVFHYCALYAENLAMIMLAVCLEEKHFACQFKNVWFNQVGFAFVTILPIAGGALCLLFHWRLRQFFERHDDIGETDA